MPKHKKQKQRKDEAEALRQLESRAQDAAPEPGSVPRFDVDSFSEFPISSLTLRALKQNKFTKPTKIQAAALPHALAGRDVLGASHTGSGKTLAFIIPVVERLYRAGWTALDGVGAVIVSPTRELSLQIFDVLRIVAAYHDITAGLFVGGKDVDDEKRHILTMNIIVCTPGRLRHHVESTDGFTLDNVLMVVLDEADRILDMGFEADVNAIIEALPSSEVRQTMLFSATQTRRIRDLARLSLVDPEFVAVHKTSATSTPRDLAQHYIIVELQNKLDTLYSFIKTHLKAKILVFFSSCKQVRFAFESFRHLRPGVVLMEMHGRMKQQKRIGLYQEFCERRHCVMCPHLCPHLSPHSSPHSSPHLSHRFATDVAARGLDFPSIDWVVQVDCPEDVESYIHRVGRTARYDCKGQAVLFLLPSESMMVDKLHSAKVPMELLEVNSTKMRSLSDRFAGMLAQNPPLKHLAEKAFINYVKNIHFQGDKDVFDVMALPLPLYATSMGLISTPRLRFLQKKKGEKREEEGEERRGDKPKHMSHIERVVYRRNQDVFSDAYRRLKDDDDEDDDPILVSKGVDMGVGISQDVDQLETVMDERRQRKRQRLETDNVVGDVDDRIAVEAEHVQSVDPEDRRRERVRRREKRREKKERMMMKREEKERMEEEEEGMEKEEEGMEDEGMEDDEAAALRLIAQQ